MLFLGMQFRRITESILNNESVIQSIYGSLSKMELQVLSLYMEGFNYVRIGEIIGKNPKAVDNAIQRIRGKINSIKLK